MIDLSNFKPEREYVVIFKDNKFNNQGEDKLIYSFKGWFINDTPQTEIDLSTPNLGVIYLKAIWNEPTLNYQNFSETGYINDSIWYGDSDFTIKIDNNNDIFKKLQCNIYMIQEMH